MLRLVTVLMTALALAACSDSSDTPTVQQTMDQLQARFESEREAVFESAAWTSPTTFRVGVKDNSQNRDGLAVYVCGKLREAGLSDGYAVEVVDIAGISGADASAVLGSARCAEPSSLDGQE